MPSASPSNTDVPGMGPAGQGNAAYEQAYRTCMKSRGF
jgi:hypothetical protein